MMVRHHEIDPRELFWAVLDGSLVTRNAGVSRDEQLRSLFESKLPVPLESVHCAFIDSDGDGVLAVAAPHELLEALCATAPWTTSAAPRGWPPPVVDRLGDDGLPPPSALNLLTGPYEPADVRRLRRHARLWIASTVAVLMGLIGLGGEWRRASTLEQSHAIDSARVAVLEHVLPARADSSRNPQPPELRLQIALRELAMTRRAPAGGNPAPRPLNSAPPMVLGSVLAAWPPDLEIRLQTLELVEDRLTLAVETQDAETLQHLLVALDAAEGLDARPLQGGRRASGYGGTLTFRVEAATGDVR